MKVLSAILGALLLAASSNAQYFSEGWKPGQAVPSSAPDDAAPPSSAFKPPSGPQKSFKEQINALLDVNTFLQLGPVQKLFNSAGVNITDRIERAKVAQAQLWDHRIPLITDDNYGELIVNETLTEEEEKSRVWFLVITVSRAKADGISGFVDKAFDSAFNLTQDLNDLPNVRWGRIDYINVTAITTKWAVWNAPYLVVLQDRGQTLRFYKGNQIRLTPQLLHDFLKEEAYSHSLPWQTAFAPGGSREWLLDYLAIIMTKQYNAVNMLPRWMMYMITGALGSVGIGLLHTVFGGNKKAQEHKPATAKQADASAAASSGTSTAVTPKPSPAKKTKGGKKGGKK